MIQVFQNEQKTNNFLTFSEEEFFSPEFSFKSKWINLTNPTDKEIEFVASAVNVSEDFLKAPLDDDEGARMETDDGAILIICDVPIIEEDNGHDTYSTLPLGIILKNEVFITVCLQETAVVRDFIRGRVKSFTINKNTRFLFQILYNVATKFLHYLRQINKSSQRIQSELHRSMKNKELIQLLDLENSLVYFSTSLKSDENVISKLIKFDGLKKFEEDNDLLEDVSIEISQAIEMCNIYRDILSGTMDAFASVISNNLNIVMKFLTSVTLIISIPTLIASIFGMNVKLPFEGLDYAFWIIVGVSVLISIIIGLFLKKKKLM